MTRLLLRRSYRRIQIDLGTMTWETWAFVGALMGAWALIARAIP